jgi:hypothetical protein
MTNVNHTILKGTSDEHYTPKFIFDDLGLVFDLDVAAPVQKSNVPALHKFDINTDGLKQDWFGNVWMNPPYSKPTLWVEKFIAHKQGIALLPVTRGLWWDKLWQEADAIMPLAYNAKFDRPNGLPARSIVFRTCLYAFGEINVKALHRFNRARIR